MEKRLKAQNIFSEYPMLFQIENKRVCHKSVTHPFLSSIPQLFQKIACWTQNCYYDVLGLYLNAVFLVTSHFFPLPHNAT